MTTLPAINQNLANALTTLSAAKPVKHFKPVIGDSIAGVMMRVGTVPGFMGNGTSEVLIVEDEYGQQWSVFYSPYIKKHVELNKREPGDLIKITLVDKGFGERKANKWNVVSASRLSEVAV